MIEELEARRDRFAEIDREISKFEPEAFGKIGIDPKMIDALTEHYKAEMLEEAQARYRSKI